MGDIFKNVDDWVVIFFMALPLMSFVYPGVILRSYPYAMDEGIKYDPHEVDAKRSNYLAFAGFSFTALMLFFAIEDKLGNYLLPLWYVFLSFISFLGVIEMHSYRNTIRQEMLIVASSYFANLCLILSISAFVFIEVSEQNVPIEYGLLVTAVGLLYWWIAYVQKWQTIHEIVRKTEQALIKQDAEKKKMEEYDKSFSLIKKVVQEQVSGD